MLFFNKLAQVLVMASFVYFMHGAAMSADQLQCHMNAQNDMVCAAADQNTDQTVSPLDNDDPLDTGNNTVNTDTSVIIMDNNQTCDADGNPTKYSVSSVEYDSGTGTVTVTSYAFNDNDRITISGASDNSINGTFNINRISDRQFTYQIAQPAQTPITGHIKAQKAKVDQDGNGVHDECDEAEEDQTNSDNKNEELAKLEDQIKKLEDMIKKVEAEYGKLDAKARDDLAKAIQQGQQGGGGGGGGQNPMQDLMKQLGKMLGGQSPGSPPGSNTASNSSPPGSPPPANSNPPPSNAPPAQQPDTSAITDKQNKDAEEGGEIKTCDLDEHAVPTAFDKDKDTYQTIDGEIQRVFGINRGDGKDTATINATHKFLSKSGQAVTLVQNQALAGTYQIEQGALTPHVNAAKTVAEQLTQAKCKQLQRPTEKFGHCFSTMVGAASYNKPGVESDPKMQEAIKQACGTETEPPNCIKAAQTAKQIGGLDTKVSENLSKAFESLCNPPAGQPHKCAPGTNASQGGECQEGSEVAQKPDEPKPEQPAGEQPQPEPEKSLADRVNDHCKSLPGIGEAIRCGNRADMCSAGGGSDACYQRILSGDSEPPLQQVADRGAVSPIQPCQGCHSTSELDKYYGSLSDEQIVEILQNPDSIHSRFLSGNTEIQDVQALRTYLEQRANQ